MKKTKPEYKDAKLNEFRDRLRPIPIKNLKRLVTSYQEEIARLTEYLLVIQAEIESREINV